MLRTYHTDEELISELHRFHRENNRVPKASEMTRKNGYPSLQAYITHFKTFNNALIRARLKPNRIHHVGTLDGTEICSYCAKRADEIPVFRNWYYDEKGNRFCDKHGRNQDYIKGNLDINSTTGLGRAGEILIVKTLKIGDEHDCNRISCGYKFDLYHNKYKKINVKTSLFNYEYNNWTFGFNAKKVANTYICIGLSSDRSIVEHVWVVPNEGYIRNLSGLKIYNTFDSLYNRKHWEVDAKPYNDIWQTMKLDNCKIMINKNKVELRSWEETLEALAELNKKYCKKLEIIK